jgi:hypothetical protein
VRRVLEHVQNDRADALGLVRHCYHLGVWFHSAIANGPEPPPFTVPVPNTSDVPLPMRYTVPRQLPARLSMFAGRQTELHQLDQLLNASRELSATVIAAITGTAGIGKTALAMYWAHEVEDRFPDGQRYVNLRAFDSGPAVAPGAALRGFLEALGVTAAGIPDEVEARAALYRSLVADRRILIVLDNAASATDIQSLLPGTSSCLVVVTSRNHLDGLSVQHVVERDRTVPPCTGGHRSNGRAWPSHYRALPQMVIICASTICHSGRA